MPHTPKLDLGPDDNRTALFRTLVKRLRADGPLGRVVKTWRVWDGSHGEAADPTLNQLPWVRISPMGAVPVAATQGTAIAPVRLSFEVAVPGTNADDLMNLWGRIHKVLLPGDGSVQTLIEGQRGIRISPEEPAFGVRSIDNTVFLAAEGSFVVNQLQTIRA